MLTGFIQIAWLEQVTTFGLVGAALVSLAWLARPFPWRNRLSLLLVFTAAGLCALYQGHLRDETLLEQAVGSGMLQKHLLLVLSLALLLWGAVVAAHMERVHEQGQ